jgi:hypothetical protein
MHIDTAHQHSCNVMFLTMLKADIGIAQCKLQKRCMRIRWQVQYSASRMRPRKAAPRARAKLEQKSDPSVGGSMKHGMH